MKHNSIQVCRMQRSLSALFATLLVLAALPLPAAERAEQKTDDEQEIQTREQEKNTNRREQRRKRQERQPRVQENRRDALEQKNWTADDDGNDLSSIHENGVRLATFRERIEKTIPFAEPGRVTIDAGAFGGVKVTGWDQPEVKLVAKKEMKAITEKEARELAKEVQILTQNQKGNLDIRAQGPDRNNDIFWSVSFELFVPRSVDLDLKAKFGGVAAGNVAGNLRLATEFGGLDLKDVAGNVSGKTKFGGVTVELDGKRWEGDGLNASTEFGGITASLPKGFSAELEAGTSFGSADIDFPITVRGSLNRKTIKTRLGDGGAPVRLMTKFGGVAIRER